MRPGCLLDRTKNLHQYDGLHFISDSYTIHGDLLLYAVTPDIECTSIVQVNPRVYKCGVTTYYLYTKGSIVFYLIQEYDTAFSCLQILFIPLNSFLDPLLEIILRCIAEILADLRDVRPTVANIALALRIEDRL